MKELKTIQLKGKDYVMVQERVAYFNDTFKNGSIITSFTPQGEGFVFQAHVTPDLAKPERYFTGHSYGEVGLEKAMEKLETVAVGRALAFMGIGIVDGIASADEIDNFHNNQRYKTDKERVLDNVKNRHIALEQELNL